MINYICVILFDGLPVTVSLFYTTVRVNIHTDV